MLASALLLSRRDGAGCTAAGCAGQVPAHARQPAAPGTAYGWVPGRPVQANARDK